MSKEVDNHNIENQKIREEFEGMLRSFDKLIEENRKKKIRIEELLVNKALLEKNIKDLEKDVKENLETIEKKDTKIDKLEDAKRELEMQTGIIPELKEQISIVRPN
jgi:chromosome segregation ATPase